MASLLRRPFAITATLRQATQSTPQTLSLRAFHNTPLKAHPHLFRPAKPTVSSSQNVSRFQQAFRRGYQQAAYNPMAQGDMRQRLLYGAGIFGATLV